MHTLAETQVRIGFATDVELIRVSNAAPSRLAEPSQICTFCPASIAHPASSTSRVAVRRFDGDGDVHRTISSTAVGNNDGSSRNAANWPGCSASASIPPPTALRVVSAPALNSRLKNRYSSISERAPRAFGPASRSRPPTACRRSARPAWPRSAPGRRCTSACRLPRASSAPPTPCASHRSRTAARSPRTANAVPTQALPAECRSSASAVRRRFRPGSRAAPPVRPHPAVDGRGRADRPRPADHSRCQPGADQPPDLRMPRVVHHVQHLTRDGRDPAAACRQTAACRRSPTNTSPDHAAPQAFPHTWPPTRSPRRRACYRSVHASRRVPRDDAPRTGRAESRWRSCPDR